ncbi:G5 domain-containing protein [Actinomadura barringtoniae]|uniref:G5 domain-containing protein n=1 Tax=Actinomadura barringtoniae TaxID=1427535 RepID=UPI0027DBFE43|nr:G5 domain-containing protein [Actinomadura barringtoniae]
MHRPAPGRHHAHARRLRAGHGNQDGRGRDAIDRIADEHRIADDHRGRGRHTQGREAHVTTTTSIPYRTTEIKDASLTEGTTKVRRPGVKGVKRLTYEVTLSDGAESGRRLLRQTITRQPITRVVAIGTKPESRCDPNYSGACVPIASDVDCAGGSGDGPAYVQGPVRVVGSDIYDLDRDGDGTACDT